MRLTPSHLHTLRLRTYRRLFLLDTPDGITIQSYNAAYHKAQQTITALFTHLQTHPHLTPIQQADHLLTIFVLLQLGFRNSTRFLQATQLTYQLLPTLLPQLLPLARDGFPVSHLPHVKYAATQSQPSLPSSSTPSPKRLLTHLLLHLYLETQDETLLPNINQLLPALTTSPNEEDHYLLLLYHPQPQ